MLLETQTPAKTVGEFGRMGEFLKAVVHETLGAAEEVVPGGLRDRLRASISAAASGLGEVVPSDGGFLVQSDLSRDLINRVYETGEIASRVQRISLTQPNTLGLKIAGVDEVSRADGRGGAACRRTGLKKQALPLLRSRNLDRSN